MATELMAALHKHFGFTAFRSGQEEAIRSVLEGRDTTVVMPTGAGKSLVYQLAALLLPGVTLVVSPLIALMKDQVDALTRRGIAAAYINSTLSGDEQQARLQALAEGALRLVYVAPERLRSLRFRQALQRVPVSLLAVDEAHCISQWGHDFRPDYLHIAETRALLRVPVTIALTATATPQVQDDIIRQLTLASAQRIVTGFNRPNLSLRVVYASDEAGKLRRLADLLTAPPLDGGAIIYTGTRHDAEEVGEFVAGLGVTEARYYHAGLPAAERSRIQESFIAGDLPVVVATNAFGMGIDRPDVRLVAHYDMPGTLEAYYQEAGRAGRDGEPARAVLLYSPKDRALQEWFINNDAPTAGNLRKLYDALPRGEGDAWVSLGDLSLASGLPEVKIRVGIAQLEEIGALAHLGDDGPRLLLRRGAWNAAAAQAVGADVDQRRQQREAQLETMIAYAEANTCRRRIILDHFGDRGSAEAAVCCDNCQAAAARAGAAPGDLDALSRAERAALIILDTVRRLAWGAGRKKLAQTLGGSQARAMSAVGYDQNLYYGRLAVFKIREVERMIDQLTGMGYLKLVGGEQPVLRLTPQGQAAIKERAAINLRLPRLVDDHKVARKQRERQAGDTVALTAQMFAQGLSPAHIAGQRGLTESTIYNHLAQLIGRGEVALEAVVPAKTIGLVQSAIARLGLDQGLAAVRLSLPQPVSYDEIRCVVTAWRRERGEPIKPDRPAKAPPTGDAVADFLARPHPRPLPGPWQEGWSLGFHSGFGGSDWKRSQVGDLAYRLKYEGDAEAVQPLVDVAAALCREHPALANVDAIVPIPPSVQRAADPVSLFSAGLAARLGKPVLAALVKTRQTQPQKELTTLAQKRANVAGAFAVQGNVRGKRVLLVDDLYDSGATLEEATRVLRQAGAASVGVLTLTRTIHSDR